MKRAYYYLFYKLYKFWEAASDPKFWSDWKAGVTIVTMELWIIISAMNYYNVFINKYFEITKAKLSIWGIIIVIINYFAFLHTDVWRLYIKEFDQLPKRKNKHGTWVVLSVVLFVAVNFIFSFYLISRIDWSKYR